MLRPLCGQAHFHSSGGGDSWWWWSEELVHNLKSIGMLQGQQLGISPAKTTGHLFRLAISIWMGNATSWICRQIRTPVVDSII